jgi:RimJ/RimL family protein N-acetyltransferase
VDQPTSYDQCGLPVSREDVIRQISEGGPSKFQHLLIVTLKSTGQAIGKCKLHQPDLNGIAATDVKLLPEFWGNKYGVEIKRGMLDYLFTHTTCQEVEATPNLENIASNRMQEAVGGVCIGKCIYEFPESMRGYTTPVHHAIFRVSREKWKMQREL